MLPVEAPGLLQHLPCLMQRMFCCMLDMVLCLMCQWPKSMRCFSISHATAMACLRHLL